MPLSKEKTFTFLYGQIRTEVRLRPRVAPGGHICNLGDRVKKPIAVLVFWIAVWESMIIVQTGNLLPADSRKKEFVKNTVKRRGGFAY